MNLLFIGCGKMGGSVMSTVLRSCSGAKITVVDKKLSSEYEVLPIVKYTSIEEVVNFDAFDLIFLAIKPQDTGSILCKLQKCKLHSHIIFVSIVAGKKINFFESFLGEGAKIVRTMPNILATVKKSSVVAVRNNNVSDEEFSTVSTLFRLIGKFYPIDNEELLDSLTAFMGSGPAYIFLLMEYFIKAASELDINPKLAKEFVLDMFEGSSILARTSDRDIQKLREDVTSPKGTTEAGLKVLISDEILENLIKNACQQAKKRAIELSL